MPSASLQLYQLTYKLPQPITIASYTWTHLENVIVKLSYDNCVGIGEAAPFAGMTGESCEQVITELRRLKTCRINPQAGAEVFYHQIRSLTESRHAAAALDTAFHDLIGKMQNKPVYRLFGNEKYLAPNSLTIPMLSVAETSQFAVDLLKRFPDVRLIKIKIDDANIDTRIAAAIKKTFPEHVAYVIDPNQGFQNAPQAISVLKDMQSILKNIIAIEQPVAKEDYQGLAEIKSGLKNIAIYADESVVTLHDLDKIIRARAVDGINIKIQKAGGIWHAKQMAKRAHEAGLKIMTGCMLESPIGTAAGLHFAVSTPHVAFTDIDSDLFLFQELEKPLFTMSPFRDGIRFPFEKPGLGIEIHDDIAHQLVQQQTISYEEII